MARERSYIVYGFTVIEMLVVVAIIGILSVMGLTELRGAKESARDATRMSDLAQIRLALNMYYDDNNYYPAPVMSAVNPGEGPDISTTLMNGTVFSQEGNPLFPGYISRVLKDPFNKPGSDLYYQYDTNQNNAHKQYVFCFHKEGVGRKWFYFYSTGIYGEGNKCPSLPTT